MKTQIPSRQCVWFDCDANNAIGTLSIPHECRFDHHVSPHAIPNTRGMTSDMLSFRTSPVFMLALQHAGAGNTDHNEHNLNGEQRRSRGSCWF